MEKKEKSVLSENFKRNLLIVFIIFIGFPFHLYSIVNKKSENIVYQEEDVCGYVIRLNSRYQGKGVIYHTVDFRLDKYGFVSYDTDAYFKDSRFNLDFSKLKKDQEICFLIRKPMNIKIWNNHFSIVGVLGLSN